VAELPGAVPTPKHNSLINEVEKFLGGTQRRIQLNFGTFFAVEPKS
jgi:hypothetical protein